MYTKNEIVQTIISRLPEVHTVTNIDMVERHGNPYVYFNYAGKRLRVDYCLSVEEVERSMLASSRFASNVQAVLRGERDVLDDRDRRRQEVVDRLLNEATHEELFEVMIGIGEPEEGSTPELRDCFRVWLNRKDKSCEDKVEIVRMFFGWEKAHTFEKGFC